MSETCVIAAVAALGVCFSLEPHMNFSLGDWYSTFKAFILILERKEV